MVHSIIQATLVFLIILTYFHNYKAEQNAVDKSLRELKSDLTSWEAGDPHTINKKSIKREAKNTKNKSRRFRSKSGMKKKRNVNKNGGKYNENRVKERKKKRKGRKNRNMIKKDKKKSVKKINKNRNQANKDRMKAKTKKIRSRKNGNPAQRKNQKSSLTIKQTCDEETLCRKIKDYIKYSNQLRKVKRITKSCDAMEKKANKSATEFDATVAALDQVISSNAKRRLYIKWRRSQRSVDEVQEIRDTLKNCSASVKAKCAKSVEPACGEIALQTECEASLQDWLNKFGPSKGSCLQSSTDCCECITALPEVDPKCLDFDTKSNNVVKSKKKCTGSSESGSFGDCRKKQQDAAVKGPSAACGGSKTTKPPPTGTTTGIRTPEFAEYTTEDFGNDCLSMNCTEMLTCKCSDGKKCKKFRKTCCADLTCCPDPTICDCPTECTTKLDMVSDLSPA